MNGYELLYEMWVKAFDFATICVMFALTYKLVKYAIKEHYEHRRL
jgi:hypothetical protein